MNRSDRNFEYGIQEDQIRKEHLLEHHAFSQTLTSQILRDIYIKESIVQVAGNN